MVHPLRQSVLQRGSGRLRRRLGCALGLGLWLGTGLAAAPVASSAAAATQAGRAPAARAAGPAGQMAADPRIDTDLYVLGPGDTLNLAFLDPSAAGVGGPISILNDGTASLALLGSVQLTGLTISQASAWLTSLYGRLLRRPQLNLTLTTPRPMKISVLGEVDRPGLYTLTTFSDVVGAIQGAGGITQLADLRRVMLRRRLPGPAGSYKQTELNLGELLQFGNQRQNPLLFDGDVLVLARATQPMPDEVLLMGASNLSPATIDVNVIGEVKAPGRIALRANTPLVEAILSAGGPNNWRANKGNVELVRLNRNGTATRQIFTLNYTKGVSNAFNPPLRANDTVIVHRSLYGEAVDVLNQAIVPLTQIANFWAYYNNWFTNP